MMSFLKKFNLNKFCRYLPWIWLVLAYFGTITYLAVHGRAYVDSDMASEMVLADLLNQEGSLFSSNWGYSTEIRVFYLQIFYRIALFIFPHNWYAARMLGQAAWMLLLAGCYLYAARGVGLKNSGAWGAAALMCPFGIWYLWYGPFGGFYIPHMVLLLLSFGFAIRIVRSSQKIKIFLYLLLLALVSFINGLGSIKGILALYLPMCMAAVLLVFLKLYRNPSKPPKPELLYMGCSLFCLLFSGIGYLLNGKLLSSRYHFLNHNDRIWSSFDLSMLVKRWCEFLSLLGFQNTELDILNTHTALFSISGLLGALSLILVLMVIASIICLFFKSKALSPIALITFYTFLCTCVVQGSVFAFTSGIDVPNPSYWLTPMPLLFLILQLGLENASLQIPHSQESFAIIFMVCIIGVSVSSIHTFFSAPPRAVPELEPVAEWLSENGYTHGYATFWHSNVLTEWSNGELDMHSISDSSLDVTDPHSWLERLDHATPPTGKVFLLTNAEELKTAQKESIQRYYTVYQAENDYLIMAFDSYDEMVTALQNAHEG